MRQLSTLAPSTLALIMGLSTIWYAFHTNNVYTLPVMMSGTITLVCGIEMIQTWWNNK